MKRFFFLILLGMLCGVVSVEAHQIKSDHSATVLLHVDPSDEPYSGTTTRMYLVFTNKKDNIKPEDCNCIAYVAPYSQIANIEEEGTKYDFSESERILGSYSIAHVFPKHDVYAVVLEGMPKEGASFEPFRIEYTLRVARGEEIQSEVIVLPKEFDDRTLRTSVLILLVLIAILVGKRFYRKSNI